LGACVPIANAANPTRGTGYIVRTARLTNLHPRDLIDVNGIVEAGPDPGNVDLPPCGESGYPSCPNPSDTYDGGHYRFGHFVGSQILLTDNPAATTLEDAGPYGEWITPHNGTNCRRSGGDKCTIHAPIKFAKSAVVSVPRGYDGRTMYVNLIANATDAPPKDSNGTTVPDLYAVVDVLYGNGSRGTVLDIRRIRARRRIGEHRWGLPDSQPTLPRPRGRGRLEDRAY
jgi:hypothetical protein